MCEDARFADPVRQRLNGYHLWPVPEIQSQALKSKVASEVLILESQSGVSTDMATEESCSDKPGESEKTTMLTKPMPEADQMMNVFYGEVPTTLRELCKRYVLTRSYLFANIDAPDAAQQIALLNKDLPYHTGYDPQGLDISSIAGNVTLSYQSPLAYFMPAFAGYRGAIRHKYVFLNGIRFEGSVGNVTRRHYAGSGNGVITSTTKPYNDVKEIALLGSPSTNAGTSVQYLTSNNTIQVELPFYNQGRIGYSRLIEAQDLNCNSHEVVFISNFQTVSKDVVAQDYVAAGEDFSLYFYTGAPILYRYSLTPTS